MAIQENIYLYDFFEIRGGAEKVALSLYENLKIDLCYGFWSSYSYSRNRIPNTSLVDLKCYSRSSLLRTYKLLHAFMRKTNFLNNYRSVIYTGTYAPLAVANHSSGPNIYYCHTPPRFIYDQRSFYMSMLPVWQALFLKGLIKYIRPHYESAIKNMDIVIANSENVRDRIKKYLNRESIVIYPPCDTEGFSWQGQGDYYLSTARLARLKRVDIIIEAFKRMPQKKLVVLSGGTEEKKLRRIANKAGNIFFTGWVNNDELKVIMGKAIATIYIPNNEDFGMSPVESMAAGKPVIGVREGGLMESVIDGETGILLNPDLDHDTLISAVEKMRPSQAKIMRPMCEKKAQNYSNDLFISKMQALLNTDSFRSSHL